jgi:hypothetical protein
MAPEPETLTWGVLEYHLNGLWEAVRRLRALRLS